MKKQHTITLTYKKIIPLIGLLFISSNFCFGRGNSLFKDTLKHRSQILYVVNIQGKPPLFTVNYMGDTKREISVEDLPEEQSRDICRLLNVEVNVQAIVLVKLKPNTKLLTMKDVFNLYKVPIADRQLTVKVEERVIDYPETVLISQNLIYRVKVIKEKRRKYIELSLKGYDKLKREREKEKKKNGIFIIQ